MKNIFPIGSKKSFTHFVGADDLARFESGTVHEVYSTFALTRDAEWSGRLFVLEMKEEGEEGIGTYVSVQHHAPALPGQQVEFVACLTAVDGNEVSTKFEARVAGRLIASGEQKQKIVSKNKLARLLESLR
ncbi:MAG: hypothetical protein JST36_10305 [Bacteroidetes bacterium]|nr:hypothetical protein [Bacteroidota bacterium]